MKAASINAVYSVVKDVANANNRGFVTPSQFNQFAVVAQQEVFQEQLAAFDNELAKRKRGVAHSRGAFNSLEQIEDTLRNLLRYEAALSHSSANKYSLPSNYAYVLNVQANDIDCPVIPSYVAQNVNRGFLSAPKETSPVCVIDGTEVIAYPNTFASGDDFSITYYKYPQGTVPATGAASTSNPTWAYTTVSNVAIYNPVNSIDFELPKSLEYRLAIKILSYIGINMREADIVQFTQLKEQQEAANDN